MTSVAKLLGTHHPAKVEAKPVADDAAYEKQEVVRKTFEHIETSERFSLANARKAIAGARHEK